MKFKLKWVWKCILAIWNLIRARAKILTTVMKRRSPVFLQNHNQALEIFRKIKINSFIIKTLTKILGKMRCQKELRILSRKYWWMFLTAILKKWNIILRDAIIRKKIDQFNIDSFLFFPKNKHRRWWKKAASHSPIVN